MEHKKLCRVAGCGNLTTDKRGYCDYHKTLINQQYYRKGVLHSEQDAIREKVHRLGYWTKPWERFARNYLEAHPICSRCGARATVCDHATMTAFQMVDAYGKFILEESYYQPLCNRCNQKKAREDRASDEEYIKQKEILEQYTNASQLLC